MLNHVISHGLIYHLIRHNTGQVANKAFTSNPTVSSKDPPHLPQQLRQKHQQEVNFKADHFTS